LQISHSVPQALHSPSLIVVSIAQFNYCFISCDVVLFGIRLNVSKKNRLP
jgi:hypothetical protein